MPDDFKKYRGDCLRVSIPDTPNCPMCNVAMRSWGKSVLGQDLIPVRPDTLWHECPVCLYEEEACLT